MTGRRALLAAIAAATAAPPLHAQTADSAVLMIPGPEGGGFAVIATRAAAGLARNMPHAVALRIEALGGPDGVTAANRFATTDGPDGRSLLLLPGAATHARMVGDTRVRFDPSGWIPLVALAQPVWLVGRGPRPNGSSRPVRVAISAPDQADAVAIFVLDLLGVPAIPVPGGGQEAAEEAFRTDRADALMICGPRPALRVAALGAEPWVRFDAVAEAAPPAFADLTAGMPASARDAGLAGAAALRSRGLVVLPALTPADQAAAWRRAAQRFAEEDAREAVEAGFRLLGPVEATALFASLCATPDAISIWRDWAARRFGARAG
ncbi:hypothetical protein ACQW02_01175 [Humitalea sp. 24SJ18S-53]|uniref:hypothetical protein n=1 Tax=Humitalea sp. 24SJ18S-53 TaxID=3422307 RepID=UPI003D665093